MVLFLNLDSSKPPPHDNPHDDLDRQPTRTLHWDTPHPGVVATRPRPSPNTTHPFTALMSSYPLLMSLTKHLDLNDLASLSSTCHPFRSLLLPQRKNLTSRSLVCKNSGGQVHRCVKDLVNECRRCLKPVCRNCARRPGPGLLFSRLNRLCSNHSVCSPQVFDKVCDCADAWLCRGCLGRYPPPGPGPHTTMKLAGGRSQCLFRKREGNVGRSGDSDGGSGAEIGCMVVEGGVLQLSLKLEKTGDFRRWCDWCDGVVLTAEDRAVLGKEG
ncbi:unnamed protein product [Tuber aestivum]|uniref:F-box domain-containing protein n=1 Tax=Tuber aestivum TaxID=59557 RepID=A0A292Q964_9PEZI|nr:unnamed protein product [Tuber aestivum]